MAGMGRLDCRLLGERLSFHPGREHSPPAPFSCRAADPPTCRRCSRPFSTIESKKARSSAQCSRMWLGGRVGLGGGGRRVSRWVRRTGEEEQSKRYSLKKRIKNRSKWVNMGKTWVKHLGQTLGQTPPSPRAVLEVGLRAGHVVLEVCECHLRLYHPKLCQVARRVAVLGPGNVKGGGGVWAQKVSRVARAVLLVYALEMGAGGRELSARAGGWAFGGGRGCLWGGFLQAWGLPCGGGSLRPPAATSGPQPSAPQPSVPPKQGSNAPRPRAPARA